MSKLSCPNKCRIEWYTTKEENGNFKREFRTREAIMRKRGAQYICEKCGYHIPRAPIIAERLRK